MYFRVFRDKRKQKYLTEMKINLFKTKRHFNKIKRVKFLFLPLFYKGSMYWLESVLIRKSFNGMGYQITDVTRFKKS